MKHLAWPIIYLIFRGPLASWIDGYGSYAMTAMEGGFVLTALAVYRPWQRLWRKLSWMEAGELIAAIGFGVITAALAQRQGWVIPFDVSQTEAVLWLTLLGPVLEEAVFRLALWVPLERAFSSRVAWGVTSVLFSLAHFQAYFFVPADFQPFVLYQTAYTLVLGVWWGHRLRQSSLAAAVLAHVAFNVGFWLMIR